MPDSLAERSNGDAIYYGDQSALYSYVNDNWRIRRNLTLNLGVRYEYTTIPYTKRLQNLNPAASVPGLIDFSFAEGSEEQLGAAHRLRVFAGRQRQDLDPRRRGYRLRRAL